MDSLRVTPRRKVSDRPPDLLGSETLRPPFGGREIRGAVSAACVSPKEQPGAKGAEEAVRASGAR